MKLINRRSGINAEHDLPPDQMTQKEEGESQWLQHQQEELAGVDSSIVEGIEAVRAGREAVAQRLHGGETGSNPLQIVQSGRNQVLRTIVAGTSTPTMSAVTAIQELNAKLTESLAVMAERVP